MNTVVVSSLLLCAICGVGSSRVPTFVSTHWLHDYVSNTAQPTQEVRVLETGFNLNALDNYTTEYRNGHIPQAGFFDLNKCVQSTAQISRNIPEPNCLTQYIQSLGVWPNTHVIVYARSPAYTAFRTWWLFRLFGLKKISILDGGFNKWTTDGFRTSLTIPPVQRSSVTLTFDRSLIRTFEDMIANVASQREQVVDARPGIAGIKRIPNAKVVPYTTLLNNDGTMKPYPVIKTLFEDAGLNIAQPMVTYCYSGMTATIVAAVAHVLGKDIPVYYGSWNEWNLRAPDNLKIPDV